MSASPAIKTPAVLATHAAAPAAALCPECPTPDICVPAASLCRNQLRWVVDTMDLEQRRLEAFRKLGIEISSGTPEITR